MPQYDAERGVFIFWDGDRLFIADVPITQLES